MNPASAAYMILPHLNLSQEIRERVIMEEMAEGRHVWSDMTATINGQQTRVSVCREWGAFVLGDRVIVLPHYPLQALNIDFPPTGDAAEKPLTVEPIIEQKEITAKYRVTKRADKRISFAPVQRVHRLDTGAVTELVDIELNLNLNDKLRKDFGEMGVGDEKDFTLGVTVVVGYRPLQQDAAAVTQ